MGAILGGTMRSPFYRHRVRARTDAGREHAAAAAGRGGHRPWFTVLLLPRSILTEKVARRGFHVSREYAVDPLEILFVREVMRTNTVCDRGGYAASTRCARRLHGGPDRRRSGCIRLSTAIDVLAGVSPGGSYRRSSSAAARPPSARSSGIRADADGGHPTNPACRGSTAWPAPA